MSKKRRIKTLEKRITKLEFELKKIEYLLENITPYRDDILGLRGDVSVLNYLHKDQILDKPDPKLKYIQRDPNSGINKLYEEKGKGK